MSGGGAEEEQASPEAINAAFQELLLATSRAVVQTLVKKAPFLLDESVLAVIEGVAGSAEQDGRADFAELVRERLAILEELHQTAQAVIEFACAEDEAAARQVFAKHHDLLLLVEAQRMLNEQIHGGDAATEKGLAERRELLRRLRGPEAPKRPPLMEAVIDFASAEDEAAAREVFAQHHELLLRFEAQHALDEVIYGTDAAWEQRVAERRELLRKLRGAEAQTPKPPADSTQAFGSSGSATFDSRGLRVDQLTQIAGNQYNDSAIARDSAVAIVIHATTIHQVPLEPRWIPPAPEGPPMEVVERGALDAVAEMLSTPGGVAITSAATLTVQGMPGVGKTVLSQRLAQRLVGAYPGGIFWERLGGDIRTADQVNPILNRWGSHAYGMQQKEGCQFAPDAVRALLSGHGRMLVVLDDVWFTEAVRPLLAALPPDAHRLITTRSERVATDLGFRLYPLDVLGKEEARDLIRLRLMGRRALVEEDEAWIDALAENTGRHALALDVAMGSLSARGADEWASAARQIADEIRTGTGLGELPLDESERNNKVESSLKQSYDALDGRLQGRFRALGAIALDAEFSTEAAAALWGCDAEAARPDLNRFANAALLMRQEAAGRPTRFRQHTVLRAYSLALLRRAGEHDKAATRYAAFYGDAMRKADGAGRFHEMLPELGHLRHAFSWAVGNDLAFAQRLLVNTSRMARNFGAAREYLDWSRSVLEQARRFGTDEQRAQALLSFANALTHIAALVGEDRKTRLFQALDAYDDNLRFFVSKAASDPSEALLFNYALALWNSGNTLCQIADLPDEDRKARLYCALEKYDEALRFLSKTEDLGDYARTQHNRAELLSKIACLPGEDRRARLFEALEAFREALRIHTADSDPLEYASIQDSLASLLSDIASLPGEDRRARLVQALSAYDEALRFRTDEAVPFDYAATQNNRGNRLWELAALPSEDSRDQLARALEAYDEALRFYTVKAAPLAHAQTQSNRASALLVLAALPGEDRRGRLLQALDGYHTALLSRSPATAPLPYAETQNNRACAYIQLASIPGEDRDRWLRSALSAAWEAYRWFERLEDAWNAEGSRRNLQRIRMRCGDAFGSFWSAVSAEPCPPWLLSNPAEQLYAAFLAFINSSEIAELRRLLAEEPDLLARDVDKMFAILREQNAGNEQVLARLQSRQDLLRACRENGVEVALADLERTFQRADEVVAFGKAIEEYNALVKEASADPAEVAAWQRAAEGGEALRQALCDNLPGIDTAQLKMHIARTYLRLAEALEAAGQTDAATDAKEHVAALVELSRLDEALAAFKQGF
jgi:hypothetical protein